MAYSKFLLKIIFEIISFKGKAINIKVKMPV